MTTIKNKIISLRIQKINLALCLNYQMHFLMLIAGHRLLFSSIALVCHLILMNLVGFFPLSVGVSIGRVFGLLFVWLQSLWNLRCDHSTMNERLLIKNYELDWDMIFIGLGKRIDENFIPQLRSNKFRL